MIFTQDIQEQLKNYNVKTLHQFGSTLSKDSKDANDIDLIVEFYKPIGLWKLNALQRLLEEYFHKQVDLLTPNGLSQYLVEKIDNDKKLIYEK
jgi:predicted nucleotidyltransferase